MKQKLFTLLLAIMASVGTMFAEKVQIGNLYYNLDATNQTAEVAMNSSASGEIIIPSSVTYASVTYSVTSIGNSAFEGCRSLTSVTIPNSVTSIGQYAFYKCTGLTSVTIPNSVTSIGNKAFYLCTGLTSVVWNAKNCNSYNFGSQVNSFTFGNEVEHIPANLCNGMSNLTSIEIPNSVTSIGKGAFYDCTGLTSVTIGNSVTSIGERAFDQCTGLTSIEIPNSVDSIGDYAFHYCYSLTSVTIPNSVTSIGSMAFYGCSSLTSVTIPNSVTSIEFSAFGWCTGLTSIEIPNSVTSIGNYAFAECTGLTSVTIPNSVTSIGYNAFEDCTGLTSVTIGNSVTSIGVMAFAGCSGLTSIEIPNSVDSIGGYAFYYCYSLTSIVVENGNSVYDSRNDCNAIIETATNTLIVGCQSTIIPNSVTNIGKNAFYGCDGLTSITIPNSVTSIGSDAFAFCDSLSSVTIEAETPLTLGSDAFYNTNNCPIYVPCGTLEAYKTAWSKYASRIRYAPFESPNFSTNADHGQIIITALEDYTNATKCDYPYYYSLTVTPDYGYHFTQWSDGLKDNPRTIVLTQDTTFTAEFAYDRVGTCGKDLALVWSYDPTNKVLTIGNAGEFTENMQFGVEAPNEMEELVIGNSVTAIGENAFAGIETLKKVSIGESVKAIGEQAFFNCVNLETIFNYRPTPTNAYSTAFDGVDKFECVLYVLPNSIDMYKAAAVWRDFYYTYAIGAEETTIATNDVQVEPQDNAATLTWPTSNNAASYTIQITKDGVLFCTLVFNANGQLTGIAFAPSRDGQAHAPAAIMTANGLQFTVTGLNSGTQYGYNLTAKDANDQTVATYSGSFTTTGEGTATGFENVQSDNVQCTKVVRDGQIFILRGDKTYTLQGQEVK